MPHLQREHIIVIDCGSQVSQLIARRLREAHIYSEIVHPSITAKEIRLRAPKGIILSGGPASVYARHAPKCAPEIFSLGIPVLGICYGMQLGCHAHGCRITPAKDREFGRTQVQLTAKDPLFTGVPRQTTVWMSHGDHVSGLQKHFKLLAKSENCGNVAVKHKTKPFYGVQFHPEVVHTQHGARILKNFARHICSCHGTWRMKSYVDEALSEMKEQIRDKKVICGLSGGVDSAVVAALLHRAIGNKLFCVFVDNGLVRLNEAKMVKEVFQRQFKLKLKVVNAEQGFLRRLKGVKDPERKRKIIGSEFINVFKHTIAKLKGYEFLAQGTLYPDVIESQSVYGGPTSIIKSHHNVGGLPARLGFKLVEPLRTLFKDEVREMGAALGLPNEIILRQPFPGPGLAVRILGSVTKERCNLLRQADKIIIDEIEKHPHHKQLWQYFGVLLPVQSVGVMGDERTYENAIAIRAVESSDGMTADWSRLPYSVLSSISSRVINEVRGINRVVYDISSKPPSTIEWE